MNIDEVKKILEKAQKEGVHADLRSADLRSANLRSADLRSADLSQTKGLLKAREWIAKNFKKTKSGFVVYKRIGATEFNAPKSWKIESKAFIEEVCNPLPTSDCACGVNFGTTVKRDVAAYNSSKR